MFSQSELCFYCFGSGRDIFIEALYIYVCTPIFIYIFKEIQVCTDVGLFSANRPLSAVNEIMSVSSFEIVSIFSLTHKIIDLSCNL